MPKAHEIKEKYINGILVDKENDTCFFNDETHAYYDKQTMERYTSVTTMIHSYAQPFDATFWSAYKALEELLDDDTFFQIKAVLLTKKKIDYNWLFSQINIDKILLEQKIKEILNSYDKARDDSCVIGSAIHLEKELSFYGKKDFNMSKYGFDEVCGEFRCEQNYYKLDLDRGVYPEFMISCDIDGLKISGQIDLLIKDGNDIWLIDWKGLPLDTPIATPNGWTTMKDLNVGDFVFDKNGNVVTVLHKSAVHNNPCYKITFDNNDEITADEDHNWEVSFKRYKKWVTKIMTTKELFNHLKTHDRLSYNIPKIINPKPIQLNDVNLPIDPYILGCWLGDGSCNSGMITNMNDDTWTEIKKRWPKVGPDIRGKRNTDCRQHTLYGLRTELKKLNLLNNKHIPDLYQRASFEQRLDLLRGLMDTDGYFHKKRHRFVMGTTQKWQCEDFAKLLASFGIKYTIFSMNKLCSNTGTRTPAWDVTFTTDIFNPFLTRNKNIPKCIKDNNSFRVITSVEKVEDVPTQCIEVSGDTHTYLFGHQMIVTHNTNKEIKKTSYYDRFKKKHQMMKFPLSNLMDTNYWHYAMQLSTYMYLLQKIKPELNCKGLMLIHIDKETRKETKYPVEYLKDDVERMLKHFKKQQKIKSELDKIKPIELCSI